MAISRHRRRPSYAWKNVGFNDAAWASGPSEFGYGDGDEATIVSFGGNPNARHVTTYFGITVQRGQSEYLQGYHHGLDLRRWRRGLCQRRRGGPGRHARRNNHLRDAGRDTSDYIPTIIDLLGSAFVAGQNTIAVEVHQADATSTDLSFNLTLAGVVDNDEPTLITFRSSRTREVEGIDVYRGAVLGEVAPM